MTIDDVKTIETKNEGVCGRRSGDGCRMFGGSPDCAICRAFATLEQLAESDHRSRARLCSLPQVEQDYIAGKYHGGKMPWKEETSV